MGSTLTVGWLQDHELSLANLGDSRAYLITADAIEQLTVDGDLASDLLSRGGVAAEVSGSSAATWPAPCANASAAAPRTQDGELDASCPTALIRRCRAGR